MKHKEIQQKLIFYLEQSLTDKELQEIELHLKECETCRFYFDELQKDLSLLEGDKHREASPYFYNRLKARMEKPVESIPFRRRVLQPAILSLVLIFSAILGLEIGSELTKPGGEQQQVEQVLLPFDGMQEEPIEQFLLTME